MSNRFALAAAGRSAHASGARPHCAAVQQRHAVQQSMERFNATPAAPEVKLSAVKAVSG